MAVRENGTSFWITCDGCGREARGEVRSRNEADALKIVSAEGWWSDSHEAHDLCNKCRWTSGAPTAKPLPRTPGWYANVVVECDNEKVVGAMHSYSGVWITPQPVRGSCYHSAGDAWGLLVRWATPSEVTE